VRDAARMPGVALAFSAEDLQLEPLVADLARPGARRIERPILPRNRVRFTGEAIAAVVAQDRYLAEDAAERIEVGYVPLEVVSSIEGALDPRLPALHEGDGEGEGNVIFAETYDNGDVEAGTGRPTPR
jgi:aerobic carbon-monoxide dehydrogenase large subunit